MQELKNGTNCMSDSKDFQDVESIRSGNSNVTSRPVSFPPHPIAEGMLMPSFVSPRRKEGPPKHLGHTWYIGNFFCKSTCISSKIQRKQQKTTIWYPLIFKNASALYPQELKPCGTTIEEPFICLQRRKVKDQNKIEI